MEKEPVGERNNLRAADGVGEEVNGQGDVQAILVLDAMRSIGRPVHHLARLEIVCQRILVEPAVIGYVELEVEDRDPLQELARDERLFRRIEVEALAARDLQQGLSGKVGMVMNLRPRRGDQKAAATLQRDEAGGELAHLVEQLLKKPRIPPIDLAEPPHVEPEAASSNGLDHLAARESSKLAFPPEPALGVVTRLNDAEV